MYEIGGTLEQELRRTAQMVVELAKGQGVFFAIALLNDSSYGNDRLSKLIPILQETPEAIRPDRERQGTTMKIIRVASMRTYRPFHWVPRIYNGVNGVTTRLWVWGWLSVEYGGHWQEDQRRQEEERR